LDAAEAYHMPEDTVLGFSLELGRLVRYDLRHQWRQSGQLARDAKGREGVNLLHNVGTAVFSSR
jgi:hypothetical protein